MSPISVCRSYDRSRGHTHTRGKKLNKKKGPVVSKQRGIRHDGLTVGQILQTPPGNIEVIVNPDG